ncbi:hypothetical protein AQUCO_00200042v1 [Aquilegia coerulea]|uniref:BED-type domain-containing protein n=1 Tax=Aquilegia coerulea TaxID=218851 RepID=A0A2G5F1A7_AQUCA|nr:hypothetical protein AQUCO_00200042v1 [Aquilegia coerulea]
MSSEHGRELILANVEGSAPQEDLNMQNPSSPLGKSPLLADTVGSLESAVLTGSKRRKVNLSVAEVWDHVYKSNVQPKALCKYCNEMMSYDSSDGIYTLKRHAEDCIRKITADLRGLEQNPPVDNPDDFTFDQAVACRATVMLILEEELPFSWAENGPFVRLLTNGLNPEFRPIPSRCVRNIVLKFFEEEKPILHSLFRTLPGKICLASNLWPSDDGFSYMCITAHYVDRDWKLNKRTIAFPALEIDSSEKFEIFEGIYNSILDWNIYEKVFTVTLDGTVPIDVSNRLKEALLSTDSSLRKQLFHVSCGTYIFNIIVQVALARFHHSIECIRMSVQHVYLEAHEQKFREICEDEGIQFRRLPLDRECHWNTIYLMLDAAIPYQRVFELLFSDSTIESIPTALDWKDAKVIRDILEVLHKSTKLCSGTKYVSSSVFFHQVSNICLVISKYENDPSYTSVIASMKTKIREYWGETPLALGLAACVDPRFKMSVLEVCLEVIYGYEETHRLGGSLEIIREALLKLFEEYKQKLVVSGPKVCTLTQEKDPTFSLYATRIGVNSNASELQSSELQSYLDKPSVKIMDRETFDVLGWWKAQQIRYPVLSVMARDLLTIPVSSVPLHSAFTSCGRTLKDNRKIWPPNVVEASACLKDWIDAESRNQDAKLDEIEDLVEDVTDLTSDSASDADADSD